MLDNFFFSLLLPQYKNAKRIFNFSPPSLKKKSSRTNSSSNLPVRRQKKPTILIVEDQTIAATVLTMMLNDFNCQSEIATDGNTAIRLIRQQQYDLIFMDLGLPDMDGYETARQIRYATCPTPIIALTGKMDKAQLNTCLAAGMNAAHPKPLSKENIQEILNTFLLNKEINPLAEQTMSTNTTTKIIDSAAAFTALGNQPELLEKLLILLAESLPNEILLLQSAYQQQDWEALMDIAHKLKGGAIYCGTLRLKEASHYVELAIRRHQYSLLPTLYQNLLKEITAVQQAVTQKNY